MPSMPKNIDSHCHFAFYPEGTWKEKLKNHQGLAVMGGYSPEDWQRQHRLKSQWPDQFVTAFGLHPWYIESVEFDGGRDFELFKSQVDQADFIGEVGLDFSDKLHARRDLQMHYFEKQLAWAGHKPYVFHVVQAHGAVLNTLKDHPPVQGFVHGFSGSWEVAERYMDMGLKLSFGPQVLKSHFKKARDVLQKIPLESLLLESDCPSAPGESGDSWGQWETLVQEVAKMRSLDAHELKAQLEENFSNIYP